MACTTSAIVTAAIAALSTAAGGTMRPTFVVINERAKAIEKVACAP